MDKQGTMQAAGFSDEDLDLLAYVLAGEGVELGQTPLIPRRAPFTDQQVEDYFGHFYLLLRERGPMRLEPEYASETVRRYFDAAGPYGEMIRAANVPASFVIIQRINLGLFAILARLGAVMDFRRVGEELWPWVDAPPSTELGREEAAWLSSRRTPR